MKYLIFFILIVSTSSSRCWAAYGWVVINAFQHAESGYAIIEVLSEEGLVEFRKIESSGREMITMHRTTWLFGHIGEKSFQEIPSTMQIGTDWGKETRNISVSAYTVHKNGRDIETLRITGFVSVDPQDAMSKTGGVNVTCSAGEFCFTRNQNLENRLNKDMEKVKLLAAPDKTRNLDQLLYDPLSKTHLVIDFESTYDFHSLEATEKLRLETLEVIAIDSSGNLKPLNILNSEKLSSSANNVSSDQALEWIELNDGRRIVIRPSLNELRDGPYIVNISSGKKTPLETIHRDAWDSLFEKFDLNSRYVKGGLVNPCAVISMHLSPPKF